MAPKAQVAKATGKATGKAAGKAPAKAALEVAAAAATAKGKASGKAAAAAPGILHAIPVCRQLSGGARHKLVCEQRMSGSGDIADCIDIYMSPIASCKCNAKPSSSSS